MRVIQSTYAYHSGNEKADLKVATEIVAAYSTAPLPHAAGIDPKLEWEVQQHGVLRPLKLYTNGLVGHLADGHKRVRLAQKYGIKTLPLQIVPDNLRRLSTRGHGLPQLHTKIASWVEKNLWAHEEHTVTRHVIGGGSHSIKPNKFAKCECSCGARWKEEM